MLVIAYGAHNPELIAEVRRFRAAIYAEDRVIVSEDVDETSWHVVCYEAGVLAGCLRYTRLGSGLAQIGGWCVSAEARKTRTALDLALAPFRLARELGDTRGVAHATVRHGSARILRKLGGRVIETYWDEEYGCEMQRLEFHLRAEPARLAA